MGDLEMESLNLGPRAQKWYLRKQWPECFKSDKNDKHSDSRSSTNLTHKSMKKTRRHIAIRSLTASNKDRIKSSWEQGVVKGKQK